MTPIAHGLVRGLPIATYHGDSAAISKSGLDDIERSPWHFRRMRDPGAPPREETAAQLVGNLAHCAILEPDQFAGRYPIGPAVKTRADKDWKAFAAALGSNQTPIKPDEHERAQAMRESVFSVPALGELLTKGEPEVSAYWSEFVGVGENESHEVRCRCRPDWVHPAGDGVILLDVKTFGNVSPREFARQVASMRYHVQAAFYSDGFAKASGLKVHGFVFAAVEVGYPYTAAAFMLGDDDLQDGRTKYRRNLATYAECLRTGTWPGPSTDITLINLPAYAKESPAP